MTLVENEAVDTIGERVLFDNMIIIGSDPKTYAIPSVVCLNVLEEMSVKKPCRLYGGKNMVEVAFDDRDLIHMIDSSDARMLELAKVVAGCKKIQVIPTKYTNAQRIIFQGKSLSFRRIRRCLF